MEFLQFQIYSKNKKELSYPNLVHQEPTLHTFWTDCSVRSGLMDRWMNEWMDKYTDRCMDGLTSGLIDQQSDDSFSH